MRADFHTLYPGYARDNPCIAAPIEHRIRPVCDALNSIDGVVTLWSCQGHPFRSTLPYVTFYASQASAFQVHRLVEQAVLSGRLRYYWGVTPNFRSDGSLQYTLRAFKQGRWGLACFDLVAGLQGLRADLAQLVGVLTSL